MKSKSVALASLVEDFSLYPRNSVDQVHISDLVRAIQSGQELPLIVVDEKTLRIVDGVHRGRALTRVLGGDAKVKVEVRRYESDAALFLDAVALNANHGRKLDRHDQVRIVLRLRELNVDDKTIAVALHVPEPTIPTLSVRVVYDQSGSAHPAKRGLKHISGQTLTDEQLKTIQSVRSAEAGRLCIELTRLLDNELVDLEDEVVVGRLQSLSKSIDSALQAVPA